MINEFKKNINDNFPFLKKAKLLVAVSGGIDSVVLTHLLHQLDFNIAIAHVNFRLRGIDSDTDEQFVRKMASTLNLPCYVTHFDTNKHASDNKLSIQEAARNLRYKWFEKIRQEHNLSYTLTAHNLNDNLETFLINLARGTGLTGLTGIPNINGKIVRPLAAFSREEINLFALISNITWSEDKSNSETKYTRNKIRHKVIPILQELNPNLLESFKQTLVNLQGSKAIVADRLKAISGEFKVKNKQFKNEYLQEFDNTKGNLTLKFQDHTQDQNFEKTFNIQQLKGHIQTNPKAYIYEIFSPYGFTNIADIVDLLSAQSGKQVFSKTHRLVKDRTVLLLRKIEEISSKKQLKEFSIDEQSLTFHLKDSGANLKLEIAHFNIIFRQKMRTTNQIAQFDKDLLKFPLTVRKWQKGDYFYPIGMRGKKKLSKYFKDEKRSLIEKENIWLLLSNNKIVWVIGMRQDERFKITDTTNNITKITIVN